MSAAALTRALTGLSHYSNKAGYFYLENMPHTAGAGCITGGLLAGYHKEDPVAGVGMTFAGGFVGMLYPFIIPVVGTLSSYQ
jgi:hypothetical protein